MEANIFRCVCVRVNTCVCACVRVLRWGAAVGPYVSDLGARRETEFWWQMQCLACNARHTHTHTHTPTLAHKCTQTQEAHINQSPGSVSLHVVTVWWVCNIHTEAGTHTPALAPRTAERIWSCKCSAVLMLDGRKHMYHKDSNISSGVYGTQQYGKRGQSFFQDK